MAARNGRLTSQASDCHQHRPHRSLRKALLKMPVRLSDLLALVAFLAAVTGVASLGAVFKPGAWYTELAKPAWTPPSAIFAPVWTTLYLLIAIAGWLSWRRGGQTGPLAVWIAALLFNAAWSWLLFGRHWIGAALVDIAVLWCAILVFIMLSWRLTPAASLLFTPYLLWVSFAAALNLQIW